MVFPAFDRRLNKLVRTHPTWKHGTRYIPGKVEFFVNPPCWLTLALPSVGIPQ